MPKQTFLNLKEPKRKFITDAFLREFAVKTFDEASLTDVVKNLGIAKGSVYQYFDNKLDLFMYLIQECTTVKMNYVGLVKRKDYQDYWIFFKALYEYGYQFDNENPIHSHFLHNLINNLNSPSVNNLFDEMMKQTVSAFEKMVKYEIKSGHFRNDISPKIMGFTLYKMGMAIQEQLEFSGVISPQESIRRNKSVYQDKKEIMIQIVEEHIKLIRPAFDKQEV
jgi:AcrR family transcriptional regulator